MDSSVTVNIGQSFRQSSELKWWVYSDRFGQVRTQKVGPGTIKGC